MDPSYTLAYEVLGKLEDYYPEFLVEAEMQDTALTKSAFYKAMIIAIETTEIPDQKAKRLVLRRLAEREKNTTRQAKNEIFDDLVSHKSAEE